MSSRLTMHVMRASIFAAALLFAGGCSIAPADAKREYSASIDPPNGSALQQIVSTFRARCECRSGFYPLMNGSDALAARLWMLQTAESSIDAQYFISNGDAAGKIISVGMLAAADRGVRVRFLLDDIYSSVKDDQLALLDAHPNIEVRLYNPIARPGISVLNFLAGFRQNNRRMHNKSFTADGQVTIVGGRNLADEYFEMRPGDQLIDLDVLGVGAVARDVSKVFDNFWNHGRALPFAAVARESNAMELSNVRRRIDRDLVAAGYGDNRDLPESPLAVDLRDGGGLLYPAFAEVISDPPEKLDRPIADEEMHVFNHLAGEIDSADAEVVVITPYFVPGDEGVRFWRSVVASGIRVVIVTNSLASTARTYVHAGYAPYRKALIDAGVELYEVRGSAVSGNPDGTSADKLILHSKVLIIDRQRSFVGSLNLDPRSISINSEMGIIINSPGFATTLIEEYLVGLPEWAYRVELDDHGRLKWSGIIDGAETVTRREPDAGWWLRLTSFFARLAPQNQL